MIIINNWIICYHVMDRPFCYRAVHSLTGAVVDFTRAATAISYCTKHDR